MAQKWHQYMQTFLLVDRRNIERTRQTTYNAKEKVYWYFCHRDRIRIRINIWTQSNTPYNLIHIWTNRNRTHISSKGDLFDKPHLRCTNPHKTNNYISMHPHTIPQPQCHKQRQSQPISMNKFQREGMPKYERLTISQRGYKHKQVLSHQFRQI